MARPNRQLTQEDFVAGSLKTRFYHLEIRYIKAWATKDDGTRVPIETDNVVIHCGDYELADLCGVGQTARLWWTDELVSEWRHKKAPRWNEEQRDAETQRLHGKGKPIPEGFLIFNTTADRFEVMQADGLTWAAEE